MTSVLTSAVRAGVEARYRELLGGVGANVGRRLDLYDSAGVSTIEAIEHGRAEALVSDALDAKSVQLHQFGIYAALRLEGPMRTHCVAAVNRGASVAELLAVAQVACVASGFPAFSQACEVIAEVVG